MNCKNTKILYEQKIKNIMKILVLPGDGIGPEVVDEAVKVLDFLFQKRRMKIEFEFELIGGASIDKYGVPIRDEVLEKAKNSDAILLGAVGGPKWDSLPIDRRPEAGLLKIRKALGLWANIRPIKIFPELSYISPLKNSDGIDFVVLRELTSDVYFGEPRGVFGDHALNTMIYRKEEVERIARFAFEVALKRKKSVTSVDKANVLEVSSFWRKIVSEVAQKYPDVKLEHVYVDAMTYYIILNPQKFDVVLCPNLFGDIISDEAGGIIGSLGLCPSASLGSLNFGGGRIQGLYEPVHGSAPDIAGKSIANPIATLLSTSMLCEYSLGMKEEASLIETAIRDVLSEGFRTQDLVEKKSQGEKNKLQKGKRGKTKIKVVSTKEFGDAVVRSLKKLII